MLSSEWLTTKAEVATILNFDASANDAWLTAAIPAVTAWIETLCGRQFKSRAQTYEYLAEGDEDIIILDQYPVSSITSIVDSAGGAIASTEYHLDSVKGIIRLLFNLTDGEKYTVSYVAGYTAIPDDLKRAAWKMLGIDYKMRQTETWQVRGRTSEDGSFTLMVKDVPDDVMDTINKYRRL